MSTAYTKTFIAQALAAGGTVSATVPAGRVWVVRSLAANCGTDNVLGYCLIYCPYPIPLVAYQEQSTTNHVPRFQEVRVALVAGQKLQVTTVATLWNVIVSGFDFAA
jgi:hypothetical protein